MVSDKEFQAIPALCLNERRPCSVLGLDTTTFNDFLRLQEEAFLTTKLSISPNSNYKKLYELYLEYESNNNILMASSFHL